MSSVDYAGTPPLSLANTPRAGLRVVFFALPRFSIFNWIDLDQSIILSLSSRPKWRDLSSILKGSLGSGGRVPPT
jgi:hypothetical protein